MSGITDRPWHRQPQPSEQAQRAARRLRLLTRCVYVLSVIICVVLLRVVLVMRENAALRLELEKARDVASLQLQQADAELRRVLARWESRGMSEVEPSAGADEGPSGWFVDSFLKQMDRQRWLLEEKEREVCEREALLGEVQSQLEELRRAVGQVEDMVDAALAEVVQEQQEQQKQQHREVDEGRSSMEQYGEVEQGVVGLIGVQVVGGEGRVNATRGLESEEGQRPPAASDAMKQAEGLHTLAVGVRRWKQQGDRGIRGYAEMDLGTW